MFSLAYANLAFQKFMTKQIKIRKVWIPASLRQLKEEGRRKWRDMGWRRSAEAQR
jgi:hypothetical protein